MTLVELTPLDWAVVLGYIGVTLYLGLFVRRLAERDATHYFLAKRKLPWWLGAAGFGASATSVDTPMWFAYLLYSLGTSAIFVAPDWVHGLTSLLYARRFRALRVWTVAHLEEKRFTGLAGAWSRANWAAGAVNGIIWTLAWVNYAIGLVMSMLLGWDPLLAMIVVSLLAWVYVFVSGAWGTAMTQMMQFTWLLTAFAVVAYYTVTAAGGLANIAAHPPTPTFYDPFASTPEWPVYMTGLLIFHQIWYGLGELGYGAGMQRIFTSKDLIHATATGITDAVYIQVRNFLWGITIIAALAVLMPHLPETEVQKIWYYCALAYPPPGVRGFVVAGILAIYMASVSIMINTAANYLAWDWYKRFFNPEAPDKRVILVGRISSIYVIVISWYIGWVYYYFAALPIGVVYAWGAIVGAAAGWPWVLKWLYWRVNLWALNAMSLIQQLTFWLYYIWPAGGSLAEYVLSVYFYALIGSWGLFVMALLLTKPDPLDKLAELYAVARMPGAWGPVKKLAEERGLV